MLENVAFDKFLCRPRLPLTQIERKERSARLANGTSDGTHTNTSSAYTYKHQKRRGARAGWRTRYSVEDTARRTRSYLASSLGRRPDARRGSQRANKGVGLPPHRSRPPHQRSCFAPAALGFKLHYQLQQTREHAVCAPPT